jgi:transcriptional regulator with XRE-family HTH domain
VVNTLDKRLKTVRAHFGLTQQEFADKLKIKRNTIAKYETGRGEPIDAVVSLICRTFGVNELWLRTGEGEMLRPRTIDDDLSQFFASLSFGGDDSFKRRLISVMARLDENDWKTLEKLARELAEK